MPGRSLVIVTGLPAAGKSRLAQQLAVALSLPLLTKDALKEPLLDRLAGAPAGSTQLSDASFALLFALLPGLLSGATAAIIEGNFRSGQHERELAASIGAQVRIVQLLCRIDEGQRRLRLAARRADPSRHPRHDDALLLRMPVATAQNRFLDLPGEQWVLAGDAPTLNDCLRGELLTRLHNWLS